MAVTAWETVPHRCPGSRAVTNLGCPGLPAMAPSRMSTRRGVRSRVNPLSNWGGRRLRATRLPCAGVRAMPRSCGCSASPGMPGPESSTSTPPDACTSTTSRLPRYRVRPAAMSCARRGAPWTMSPVPIWGPARCGLLRCAHPRRQRTADSAAKASGAETDSGRLPRSLGIWGRGFRRRVAALRDTKAVLGEGSTRLRLKLPEVVSVTRTGGACPERGSSHRSHGPCADLILVRRDAGSLQSPPRDDGTRPRRYVVNP